MSKSNLFVIDADDLRDSSKTLDIVFKNGSVRRFLDASLSSCVSSAKGFGKTFLLKIKRLELHRRGETNCIPQGRMLDIVPGVRFGKSLLKILKDYNNWTELWKLSISLSVVKNECRLDSKHRDMVFTEIRDFDDVIRIINSETCNTPCEILSNILSLDNKQIGQLLAKVPNIVLLLNNVNRHYSIFIDSIDERFKECIFDDSESMVAHGSTDRKVWYYAQYSLLEVMMFMKKLIFPIDVFCSIRREVVQIADTFPMDLQGQIRGLVTEICYTYEDLNQMFDIYVANSDESSLVRHEQRNRDSALAFWGYKTIQNTYTNMDEQCFHYIYRHTLQRPRDIMLICSSLIEDKTCRTDISKFKTMVNNEAKTIVKDYLKSIDPFMATFNHNEIEGFFTLLNSNILTSSDMKDICSSYNKERCNRDNCVACDAEHPFCKLYNVGLLGHIKEDLTNGKMVQSFLPPGHNVQSVKHAIMPSALYFLHPSTNDLICELRQLKNLPYALCKSFIIGDVRPIEEQDIADAVNEIRRSKTIFFSSTHYANEDLRPSVIKCLKNMGFVEEKILVYENPKFDDGSGLHSHDVCINKVQQCDTFILVINERFGGKYAGNQYREKFATLFENKAVSISWAEYWKARKTHKRILVFIKENVEYDMNTYKINTQAGIDIKLDKKYNNPERLLAFIDFIQHQSVENWRYIYRDIADLQRQLIEKL